MRLFFLFHGEPFGDMSHSDRVQEATHQDQPSMTKLATKVQTGKQISLGAQDFHVSTREGRTMAHFEVVVCIAWAKMWIHAHFWLGLPVKRSKTSSDCCVDGPAACPGSLSWLYVAMSGGLHEYHWISLAKPSSPGFRQAWGQRRCCLLSLSGGRQCCSLGPVWRWLCQLLTLYTHPCVCS